MLLNKSKYFSYKPPSSLIQINSLRSLMATTNIQIKDLHLLQEKQCLPSFVSKSERMREINVLKNKITTNLSQLEKIVHSFEVLPVCRKMKNNLKDYFTSQLQSLVYKFRETQQSFLSKMSNHEIFRSFDEETPLQIQDNSMQETKSTIFQLTSMLMELKMAVTAQTSKIDRIEFYLSGFNENVKNTNREIIDLPRRSVYFKNRIIYFLLIIVVILMILTLIKVSKSKKN